MAVSREFAQSLRGGLAAGLELACLFAAGGALAALAWAVLDPVSQPPQSASATRTSTTRAPTALPGGDPFQRGDAGAGPVIAAADGFVLHATLAGAEGEGSAILSAPGLPQASYRTGDSIGGATLARVDANQVELDHNGRKLIVAFPAGPSVVVPRTASNPSATPDRATLINAMTLSPVERGGGAIGLRIGARDPAILNQAGFSDGDIIVGVNGAGLTADSLASRRAELMSGAAVDLRVERGGRLYTMHLGRVSP